jgi:hypothetical protein
MIQRKLNTKGGSDNEIDIALFDNLSAIDYTFDIHGFLLNTICNHIYELQKDEITDRVPVIATTLNVHQNLHIQLPLFQCISVTFRVSIYLSIIKDFDNFLENPEVFTAHCAHFTMQMQRMLMWISKVPVHKIPVRSKEMTKPVFPVDKRHCYLVLVNDVEIPYRLLFFKKSEKFMINYIFGHGDPVQYEFSNDVLDTFVPRGLPSENVCVTQSRFIC